MIDLREKELPHSLLCGGKWYEIETDFRVWLMVEHAAREGGSVPLSSVFRGDIPEDDYMDAITEFMRSENATPRGSGSGERLFDFILDGDYIVASFMQAYGIDLTSVEHMHWHVFKALFMGLPSDTKMAEIMGYRGWRNSSEKHETRMRKLKEAWRLPEPGEDEQRAAVLEWADRVFG